MNARNTPARALRSAIFPFLGAFTLIGLPASAHAEQPGGSGMPGGPQGPGAAGTDDEKEGPAEAAPRDRGVLQPVEPIPSYPKRFRKLQLFEVHGYIRARSDYFHRLSLGYRRLDVDSPMGKFYPPASEMNETSDANESAPLTANNASCVPRLAAQGAASKRIERCSRRDGIASANMRLRLRPTIHVTESVRVHTMVDMLDNLVLGSTPESYLGQNPYAPIDLFTRGQHAPSAGLNGFDDSIVVKRAYGEIEFGWGLMLQFGRMPAQWGLGIVYNDGEGLTRGERDDRIRRLDNDYGDAVDSVRLSYDFGEDRKRSHRIALSYDWAASGPTTAQLLGPGWNSGQRLGQSISVDRHDNVHQIHFSIERRDDPKALKDKLSLHVPVLNYGFATWFRAQTVDRTIGAPGFGDGLGGEAFEADSLDPDHLQHLGPTLSNGGLDAEGDNGLENYSESLVNRRALLVTPDLWMRVNWKTLRVELEAASVLGRFHHRDLRAANTFEPKDSIASERTWLRQFGYALEVKHGVFNDSFTYGLDHGFASGQDTPASSSDLASPFPVTNGDGSEWADGTLQSFRFNPAYVNDLLLFRELLGTHANAFYFKPWLAYSFLRDNASFRVDIEYAFGNRANGTPPGGNRRGYGVEIDAALRYHDTQKPIFTQLQYGIMLPLGGLRPRSDGQKLSPTQTIQLQAGIEF